MRHFLTAGLMAGLASLAPVWAQETEPKDYDASTVLAVVNGTEITLGHVIVMREALPPQYQDLPDDVLLTGLLDQLVDQTLLADSLSASPDGDPLGVRLQLENDRRVALAGREVESRFGGPVDAAEVEAAYARRVEAFEPQPEFNASHILVEGEDEAKSLKAELDGGADFAELAKAHSADGSAASGGELGWFAAGRMVPEFEQAVATLEVGQVSAPVQTQFGWHLIRLNDKRDTSAPTLDELRPQIENELRQAALQAGLEAMRAGATIETPETGIPPAAIRETDLLAD